MSVVERMPFLNSVILTVGLPVHVLYGAFLAENDPRKVTERKIAIGWKTSPVKRDAKIGVLAGWKLIAMETD